MTAMLAQNGETGHTAAALPCLLGGISVGVICRSGAPLQPLKIAARGDLEHLEIEIGQ